MKKIKIILLFGFLISIILLFSYFLMPERFISIIERLGIISIKAEVATMSVDPVGITNLTPGDSFQIDIKIDDVIDLYGYQFKLGFNNQTLSGTGIIDNEFLSPLFCTENETYNSEGYVGIACTTLGGSPFSGSGRLNAIKFSATEIGESNFDLYDTKLVDNEAELISHNVLDGGTETSTTSTTTTSTVETSTTTTIEETTSTTSTTTTSTVETSTTTTIEETTIPSGGGDGETTSTTTTIVVTTTSTIGTTTSTTSPTTTILATSTTIPACREVGETCSFDSECCSGYCHDNVCSEIQYEKEGGINVFNIVLLVVVISVILPVGYIVHTKLIMKRVPKEVEVPDGKLIEEMQSLKEVAKVLKVRGYDTSRFESELNLAENAFSEGLENLARTHLNRAKEYYRSMSKR